MKDNTQRSQIARNAFALHQILEQADKVGMPSPYCADIDSEEEIVSLGMNSLEALTDWSRWIEAQIHTDSHFGATQHKIVGQVLDYPVECWYSSGVVQPSQRDEVRA